MDTTNTRSRDSSLQARPAAFRTLPGSYWRRAFVLALASIASLVSSSLVTTAYAAEECYKDSVGRIVSRRRPGFVEVACPWRPFTFVSVGASATPPPEDADTKAPVSSRASKPVLLPRRT